MDFLNPKSGQRDVAKMRADPIHMHCGTRDVLRTGSDFDRKTQFE